MSEGILSRVVGYYEEQGSYAWAEDALFYRLEELKGGQRELEWRAAAEEGIRMYERWVLLEDALLQAGGLSSEEAEEGLRTLRQLKIADSQ